MKQCTADESCTRRVTTRGMCGTHYGRARLAGTLPPLPARTAPTNGWADWEFDSTGVEGGIFGIVVVHDCGWQGGPYMDLAEAVRYARLHKEGHLPMCINRGCVHRTRYEGTRCQSHASEEAGPRVNATKRARGLTS